MLSHAPGGPAEFCLFRISPTFTMLSCGTRIFLGIPIFGHLSSISQHPAAAQPPWVRPKVLICDPETQRGKGKKTLHAHSGPSRGHCPDGIDPGTRKLPASVREPMAISPPLCPHSPQRYARQECVHHEAQIAAESTEPQIQVGESTGLWATVHRFHFNERKCRATQSWSREKCPLASAVRTSLTGNTVATGASTSGLQSSWASFLLHFLPFVS